MTLSLTLALVLLALGAMFVAWVLLRAYGTYEGLHVCACPADGRPALVRLDAWRAALSLLRRGPILHVAECSRWPARADCNQACLAEIEENCRILGQVSRRNISHPVR